MTTKKEAHQAMVDLLEHVGVLPLSRTEAIRLAPEIGRVPEWSWSVHRANLAIAGEGIHTLRFLRPKPGRGITGNTSAIVLASSLDEAVECLRVAIPDAILLPPRDRRSIERTALTFSEAA
ncbi:hypothetical protein [Oricola indica]|uniref:hypothetical protein n=1 Tax=Oricola indica TaxID=2872591 RepID=UPI001CC0EC71|nr:hypothetical protein [Oricola indica]